ncbi:MAG: S9 family peptidase [Gemmatimonadetes bacterium]|uniref:prolyl oligopeptidase n=1 Tax=Candidatus Kutchimonas denitrificans TaxID=3056748 RepID=A0AAE5C9K9_9BACT|nr:S9 family peptidase [Gemmatimonadota bacterium]NIR73517.1 S9 family peptidase [Candidatus Kutchimonas denitrificans]NIR99476.1 S9 family peptidase [Gemmatimonadota bacterium]NIT65096.1 S9 family peptidase [Gemmatimonadota bacterium]NIV23629.1 prolyl oligopeptidase family serine peptidase [Gemmatimonadota bacterium]
MGSSARISATLTAICCLASLCPLVGTAQTTPEARRGDRVDVYHGVAVPDPYRWMEEMEAPETRLWVQAQDERARRFAAAYPERDRIRQRMERIASVRRFGTPTKRGGRYFFSRFGVSGPGTSYYVQEAADGNARLLLDGQALAAEGLRLTRPLPSRDGRRLLYGTADGGSRWLEVRIIEVDSGRELLDVLTGINSNNSSLAWDGRGAGFFYEAFEVPEAGERLRARLRNARILYHRVGTPQGEDELVYRPEGHPDRSLGFQVSDDGRFLVISESDPEDIGNRVLYRDLYDPDGKVVELISNAESSFGFIGNDGTTLWFQTNFEAPRGRVIAVDIESPDVGDWVELIPEADETIDSWVGVSAVGGRFIVGYLEDARLMARVFQLDGRFDYDLELPYYGSVWSGFSGRQDDPEAFYSISGLVDPGSIYRLDVRTGRSTLFARPELSYDPNDFVTRQVFFRSADGTRVPMYLVHRKELQRDGNAPVIMYGYGFGSWAAAPWFQSHLVLWLQMGGIWALPNLRGGGEYGEDWHQAGSRQNKQNSIDDYIAATEWLIENRYTTRGLFVANASSAGGPIAGAAITQRPDLYGAALIDFPVLDMLRYDQFTLARAWRDEYGSVEDPDEFEALYAYSPYHNLKPDTCYPATLVAPGEKDETTPPLHGYKFVAALQHAQACDNPIFLRVSWDAGHAYGADLERAMDNWADQLSFLARVLGERGWLPELTEGDRAASQAK